MSKTTGRAPKAQAIRQCKWVPEGEQPHAIDPAKLIKSPRMLFCCIEHSILWRQANGLYTAMGAKGNESQKLTKQKTGKIPGHERRGAFLINRRRATTNAAQREQRLWDAARDYMRGDISASELNEIEHSQ